MFARSWSWAVALTCVSVLLTACGGGGGGSSDSNGANASASNTNASGLSATRHYGDQWQFSVTQNLQGQADPKSLTRMVKVEAVRPDGSYSLSISVPQSDSVATELHDINNNLVASGRCVYGPKGAPGTSFQVGQTWVTTGQQSCVDSDTTQTTWTVLDDLNTIKAGISLHVYQLHRVTKTVPSDASGAVQDPSLPNVEDATCLWAPDIGLYVQCSTTYSYPQTPTAGAVTQEDYELASFTPNNASATPPAATSAIYPAWQPATWPQVGPPPLVSQPTVLAAPRLVPVYFSDTQASAQAQKTGFLQRLIASPSWAVLGEYGVSAATVAADVKLGSAADTQVTDSGIQSLLSMQITNGTLSVDANTFVVLFYPPTTTVTQSGGAQSCTAFGAYHSSFVGPSGHRVAYAVIPDCRHGIGTLTTAASHEVLEGVVDPYGVGYRTVPGDVSWALAFDGAEIGDMCEHISDLSALENSTVDGATVGDHVARIWSNASARAGHNPCVPTRSPLLGNEVYVNSVPQLDDLVHVVRGNAGVAKGVVIAPGQSKTISVHLVSDGPTYGQWHVHATWLKKSGDDDKDPLKFQWSNATGQTLSLDNVTGQNGDVLKLTITAPSKPMPDGAVFNIQSRYAGMTSIWAGAVANTAVSASASVVAGAAAGPAADGQGAAAVFGSGGRLTMAPDGSLLVANARQLRRVQLDGTVTTLSGGGLQVNPEVLATNGKGAVFSAGEVSTRIGSSVLWSRYVQRIDAVAPVSATTSVNELADTVLGGNASSSGLAVGPDGRIYVANTTLNEIEVMDPATRTFSVYAGHEDGSAGADEGVGTQASFNHPLGLSFDAQGNLYVCDSGNHKIRKIAPDGTVSTWVGSGVSSHAGGQGTSAGLASPSDIAFDASTGYFYVADVGLIWRVDSAGNVSSVIGGDLGYYFMGLTVDAQGSLYATTTGGLAGVVKVSFAH